LFTHVVLSQYTTLTVIRNADCVIVCIDVWMCMRTRVREDGCYGTQTTHEVLYYQTSWFVFEVYLWSRTNL